MRSLAKQLCSSSAMALLAAGAVQAQQAIALDPIVVEDDQAERIEQTGGVVVTPQDLQLIQPSDLSDVFSREAAVSVSNGAAPAQRIYVNGISESKLAVSIDGAQQPANIWHHNGTGQIDPAYLKSVTVQPGVVRADSGFAAAGGAIAFQTVTAQDMLAEGDNFGGRASLSYGSNGAGWRGSLGLFGRQGAVDWLTVLSRHDGDNYDSGAGQEMRGTQPALTSGLFKLGVESQEGHRLELSYENSVDDAERLLRLNMDRVRGAYSYNQNKTQRETATLRYVNTDPTAMWDPELLLWMNDLSLERPDNGYTRPSGAFNSSAEGVGGKAQNRFTLGTVGTLTAGVDFQSWDLEVERFDYGAGTPAAGRVREDWQQLGLFAQGDFALGRGFDLSVGMRADSQTLNAVDGQQFDTSGLSGNATLSYAVNDAVSVYASAGSSWLGLEQGEVALYHARDYAYDPAVEAARANSYRIGVNFDRGGWTVGASLFDTTIENPLAYDYAVVPALRTSGADLNSKGGDLSVSYGWGSGRAGLRLSHADVTQDDISVTPGTLDATPVGTTATLFADLELRQYNARVGATLDWAGSVEDADLIAAGYAPLEAYAVVSLYGEWSPPGYDDLVLRLGAENLFDEDYVQRGSYASSAVVDAVKAPGRTVTLSAVLNF